MKRLLVLLVVLIVMVSVFSETITLRYVNWNLGNQIERDIVKAFEESHPNIKVEFVTIEGNYEDGLVALAAAGKLPDVIMIPNIPMALVNDWALNIKEFVENDPEWELIPEVLRNSLVYEGGVYAVPAGMFFMGYFVNDSLFEEYNRPKLEFGPSVPDFVRAVKRMTIPSDGIIGLAEEVQIPEWYPAAMDENLGWYTWDGEKYNLDSPFFVSGVNFAKEFWNGKYVYDALPDEVKQQYKAGWWGEVWDQGKIAIRWSGTWDTANFSTLPFKARFIGVPGGRTVLVGDFMIISKTTKYPKEAYEFAKYINFSKEGILKRLELDTENRWVSLPINTDKEVLEAYFSKKKLFPGLDEAYENISKAMVEGVKIIPGYIRSRWTAPTGIKVGDNPNATIGDVIWNSVRGDLNIADYAAQLNELANAEYQKAIETIRKVLNK